MTQIWVFVTFKLFLHPKESVISEPLPEHFSMVSNWGISACDSS